MPERTKQTEGYPSLTARENWGSYALGMATEAAFALGLMALGLLLALLGALIWR